MVVKLISAIASIVLATSTLAGAAPRTLASATPRQGAAGKTTGAAHANTVTRAKPAKRSVSKDRSQKRPIRKTTARRTTAVHAAKREVKPETMPEPKHDVRAPEREVIAKIVPERMHDMRAEELEIKRLKTSVKAAEKARDWQRVARERRVMYQLEAEMRADKADDKDQQRAAKIVRKRSRIPFWGWWR